MPNETDTGTRAYVPGKQVTVAHLIAHPAPEICEKAGIPDVDAIGILRRGDDLDLTFHGDGFLYHMVRILTGTLLEVGVGKRAPGEMAAILAARDRSAAGPTAPPQGLTLMEVEYP